MRIKHNDTWVNFHQKLQCTAIGVAYDFPSRDWPAHHDAGCFL